MVTPASPSAAVPEQASSDIAGDDGTSVLYFAIGSMCNPQSLALRNLAPRRSWPAEVLDFEVRFDLGPSGMADAVQVPGASFHGVLHEMTPKDMVALDKIESTYLRATATVRRYDGEVVQACIYSCARCSTTGRPLIHGRLDGMGPPGKPAARYLEIIAAGCRHFGVEEAYVSALLSRPCEPRTMPADFITPPLISNDEDDCALETWDEARLASEPPSADSVTVALHGRVIRLSGPSSPLVGMLRSHGSHGKHMEVPLASMLFDPKYGAPPALEGFTREHCGYLLDMLCRSWASSPGVTAETVALLPQTYAD